MILVEATLVYGAFKVSFHLVVGKIALGAGTAAVAGAGTAAVASKLAMNEGIKDSMRVVVDEVIRPFVRKVVKTAKAIFRSVLSFFGWGGRKRRNRRSPELVPVAA
jgi:2-phosphoglycerate kinase